MFNVHSLPKPRTGFAMCVVRDDHEFEIFGAHTPTQGLYVVIQPMRAEAQILAVVISLEPVTTPRTFWAAMLYDVCSSLS
jgi:hypothetical protein